MLALLVLQTCAIASSPGPKTKPAFVPPSPQAVSAAPEATAGLLAKATFGWLNPTLQLGQKRALEEEDLPVLADHDSARQSTDKLEHEWRTLVAIGASEKPRAVGHAMWKAFGKEFGFAGLVKLCSDACQFAAPLLLKRIVAQAPPPPFSKRVPACAMASASRSHCSYSRVSKRLPCATTSRSSSERGFTSAARWWEPAIASFSAYRLLRALISRLASELHADPPPPRLNNLIGLDANRLSDLVPYLHALWFAPLQIALALYLLYNEVGASLIPGVALIAVMLSANKYIAKRTFRKQSQLLGIRDRRMRLVREIMSNIKVVKLHAWELIFEDRVKMQKQLPLAVAQAVRVEEISAMRALITLRSLLSAIFNSTPTLVAVAILRLVNAALF
ncbi:MAG: hypothetical protein SGPRY_003285 [Prymnesium sp.]